MPKKKKQNLSGLFVPAGIFLGMGFGFLLDELVAGMFIGLGIGFLGMLLCYAVENKK